MYSLFRLVTRAGLPELPLIVAFINKLLCLSVEVLYVVLLFTVYCTLRTVFSKLVLFVGKISRLFNYRLTYWDLKSSQTHSHPRLPYNSATRYRHFL